MCASVMVFNVSATKRFNADQATQAYIQKYTALSTAESMRSGIPVSVILAQGILESRSGTSELTQKTNNHFCIKWRSSMTNFESANFKDDTYNKKGQKVLEPFVKYGSAEESFKHHSDFLKSNDLYRNLFTFKRDDFKHWSQGLEKCGYATEKSYGDMLVRIIEKNRLDLLDIPEALKPEQEFAYNTDEVVAVAEPTVEQSAPTEASSANEGFYEYMSEANTASTKSVSKQKPLAPTQKSVKKVIPIPAVEGFYEFSTGKQ